LKPRFFGRLVTASPIKRYKALLIDEGYLDDDKISKIQARVTTELDEAVEYAEGCSEPEPKSILSGVYG